MNTSLSRHVLIAIVALFVLVGVGDAYIYWRGAEEAPHLNADWTVGSTLLLATWIDLDSRSYPEIYRPFEFGFLAILCTPVYFPYYLFRTRKWRGAIWLASFILLSALGYLLKIAIYSVSS